MGNGRDRTDPVHRFSFRCAANVTPGVLIIADKTWGRRNRVWSKEKKIINMHKILFEIQKEESICSDVDDFKIFLRRMFVRRRAAEVLKMEFRMLGNGNEIC